MKKIPKKEVKNISLGVWGNGSVGKNACCEDIET